jgi:predicted RNA binding protein YcfA (HicA-like mRNA interferase family)
LSAKLPALSGAEILKALKKAGFQHKSQRGDHVKVRHPETHRTAIVPLYDAIADGLLASILRQAGLSRDEFRGLL